MQTRTEVRTNLVVVAVCSPSGVAKRFCGKIFLRVKRASVVNGELETRNRGRGDVGVFSPFVSCMALV